jgi:hypothetical protein
MRLEQYESNTNKTNTIFTFVSEGPKGKILKRVQYSKMKIKGVSNLYNLGFGDVIKDSDKIDDLIVTDNQDRDKVLATVVNTVYKFTERYPESKIFLTGSNFVRKRLYQIAINKYFDELSETFKIKGLTEDGIFDFEKNTTYLAFLITRKI